MEVWLEHFAEKLAVKIVDGYNLQVPSKVLKQDSTATPIGWYTFAVKSLISYKGSWSGMFKNLWGEIFQLGNFRLNVYYNKEGWVDCKYKKIIPQQFEFDNIVEAVYSTFQNRVDEMWTRQDSKGIPRVPVSNWFLTQLRLC